MSSKVDLAASGDFVVSLTAQVSNSSAQVSATNTSTTPTLKPNSVNTTPTNIVSPLDESLDPGGEGDDDSDCKVATNKNQEDPLSTDSNVQSSVIVAAPPPPKLQPSSTPESEATTTTFLEDKLLVIDQTSRPTTAKQINSSTNDDGDQQIEKISSSTVNYDDAGEADDDLEVILTTKQHSAADEEASGDETLSKRAFLINRGSSISEELRKFKKQRAKLFPSSVLKRKKGRKKLKSTQTRQSSATTVSYGNLSPADQYVQLIRQLKLQQQQQQQQQHRQPSFIPASINPISSTLRQHFPSFATNTQQLSSTVQKLIMGKLSPQISGTRQSGRLVPLQLQVAGHNNNDQQQQAMYPSIVSGQPSHAGGETLTYTKNPSSTRLNEALHQWASSDELPIYASSGSLLKQAIKQQQVNPNGSKNNKMIPIEIIGLDPAVTNSIMYGSNESLRGNSHPTSDPSLFINGQVDMDHRHHEHGTYHASSIRGPHLATSKAYERPKASSILHIHHFHTQAKPDSPMIQHQDQIGSGADASSAEQQEIVVSGGQGSPADGLLHVVQQQQPGQQHVAYQQPDRGYGNSHTPQHQQVYVNDRGQLVYLSVENQNSTSIVSQSQPADPQETQQVEPQSGENQDQASWQTIGLPVEPPTNGHEQQSAQDNLQQQNEYSSGAPESQGSNSQQQQRQQQGDVQEHQQQDQQVEGNLQQDQAALHLQAAFNSSQSNGNNHLESGNNHHEGILMVPRQIQLQQLQSSEGDSTKQTRQMFLTTNEDQTIGTIGRGNEARHEVSTNSSELPTDNRQQFLMVSYKPKPQQYQLSSPSVSSSPFQNITSTYISTTDDPYGLPTNARFPYNEGQESKPSFVSANSYPGQQLFKSANILLKPFATNIAHMSQPSGHQFVASSNINNVLPYGSNDVTLTRYRPLNITDQLSHIILDNQSRASRANHTSPILQLPSRYQVQENRVPSSSLSSSPLSPLIDHPGLKSLLLTSDRFDPASSLNNNTKNIQVDLGNVPGAWLRPLDESFDNINNDNRFHFNQTNQQRASLIENSLIYKQLQKFKDELLLQQQLQQANSQQAQLKTLINNSNNANRILPHGELLSILHDLKPYNSTSNLVGQNIPNNPFNITYGNSNLATVARPNVTKQNQPQFKFINKLANNSNISQQQNGFANNNLKLANNFKKTGIEDSLMPMRSLQPIKTTHSTAQDYSEYDDSSGLSHLALAFIFIVSLITLTIIAASMFYRHRRRSSGRCTDLPAQSARKLTRNLTKRTKHFVRSNFITPNHDITSIKSINLDTSTNNSVKSPSSGASNCQNMIGDIKSKNQIVDINHRASNICADDSNIGDYLSKKAFGQTLSSFANSTPISEKYQFISAQVEDSAADIKTLNTRLQKASYLKSLISAPESLLPGCKKSQTSNRTCESSDGGGGAFYLNVRNRSHNLGHGKQTPQQIQHQSKPRSPTEYSCRISNSSKKPACDNTKNHGSPLKDHPASGLVSASACDRYSDGKNYSKKSIMSTIQSVSDCDSKSSGSNAVNLNEISSPNQTKRQSNFVCNFSKFNNLPAPKHLVASSLPGMDEQRANRGSPSDNHSQIDKL